MPTPQPSKLTVDFSGVEDRVGGKAAHVPSGDYLMEVQGYEIKQKQGETTKYINWRTGIVQPAKHKNAGTVYMVSSLKPENLWSLRNFLVNLGLKVPKEALEIPLAAIVKKKLQFGATLVDDEYTKPGTDKTIVKSKIDSTFPKADYSPTDAAPADSDEDEDSDEEEEEETEELDLEDDL